MSQLEPRKTKPTVPYVPQIPQEPRQHPYLTNEELEICLQNAESVYCQYTRKTALRTVATHFSGSKLVLCGGELTANTVSSILVGIIRRSTANSGAATAVEGGGDDDSSTLEPLALYFVSVNMGVAARLALIGGLSDKSKEVIAATPSAISAAVSAVKTDDTISRISELSVDTETTGILGTALLLRALKVCMFTKFIKYIAKSRRIGIFTFVSYGPFAVQFHVEDRDN